MGTTYVSRETALALFEQALEMTRRTMVPEAEAKLSQPELAALLVAEFFNNDRAAIETIRRELYDLIGIAIADARVPSDNMAIIMRLVTQARAGMRDAEQLAETTCSNAERFGDVRKAVEALAHAVTQLAYMLNEQPS